MLHCIAFRYIYRYIYNIYIYMYKDVYIYRVVTSTVALLCLYFVEQKQDTVWEYYSQYQQDLILHYINILDP